MTWARAGRLALAALVGSGLQLLLLAAALQSWLSGLWALAALFGLLWLAGAFALVRIAWRSMVILARVPPERR